MSPADNWHENAFFGLHYDLHPHADDTELGRETTYDHIRAMLEKVGPDFVQYDCKGHPGYTGYPTEVGSPSPGIVDDALAVWRAVTRALGIPLSIHYSGVWDTRAVERHREWARIDEEGNPSPHYTDRMSAYDAELMIPQLIEVVENYDIDGVWIDGENWASQPSWSAACTAEFTRRTGVEHVPRKPEDDHWAEWLALHRDLFVEHVARYADALHKKKPSLTVCSNWMYSVRQPEPVAAPVDYLSGDFDPSFGSDRACAEARFLSGRGMPWDLMAWAFLQTGGQDWTLKPLPHLCQEVAEVLAQGGAVFVYDKPQRSGRLVAWRQELLAGLARFCRKRQAVCHKTETIPQVAVLHSQSYYYRHNEPLFNFGAANQPMEGALHALLENGYSVDILNEEMLVERMGGYPLVVVPEQDLLPDPVSDALRAYVAAGGHLLLSGAHVATEFPDLAGVKAVEGERRDAAYVPADHGAVPVSGPWQVVALDGAAGIAPLLSQPDPELNRLDTPAATVNAVGAGKVCAIHGPVFAPYLAAHYPRVRRFIGDAVEALAAPGLIRRHGPWWIEIAARKKEGRTLIQVVNRATSGRQSPNRHMVEHVPDAGAFTLTVPFSKRPSRCYASPDEVGVGWTWNAGTLTVTIGGLAIHNVIVIE